MALTVGGGILAFGQGDHGALGTGDMTDKWLPTKVHLAMPSLGRSRCATINLHQLAVI